MKTIIAFKFHDKNTLLNNGVEIFGNEFFYYDRIHSSYNIQRMNNTYYFFGKTNTYNVFKANDGFIYINKKLENILGEYIYKEGI